MKCALVACLLGACAGSAASTKDGAAPVRSELPAPVATAPTAGTSTADASALAAGPELFALAPEPTSALPDTSASTSLGSPSNGRLEGGVPLPLVGSGFRFNGRRDEHARYATAEVIAAIQRAAGTVLARYPASELVVNDLSYSSGGRIAHHGSHRAGRDADILFYLRGDDGAYTPSVGAPIDPAGIGFDFKELSEPRDDVRVHFDAVRTWLFVAALLEDPAAEVQRIFVAEHLRAALLSAAKSARAKAETVARFADVTCQPSYPHDDHLHVRWFCSIEDMRAGCEDLPPLYPWRKDALAAAGVEPKLATRTRATDPAPIVTNEQAEQAVKRQKPHSAVLAFLARRKAWEKEPHPGRLYCR